MNRKRLLSTIALLSLALIIALLASRPNIETASASQSNTRINQSTEVSDETFANCRYGATPADDDLGEKTAVLSQLGAGWYLTFNAQAPFPPPANEAEFVHMIHIRQNKNGFDYLPGYEITPVLNEAFKKKILNNLGDIWILGNEVDRGPSPGETNPNFRGQGDTHPEEYARGFHEAAAFIKSVDPTAQIAISGLVEVTPGRLQYLDIVWNTYLQEFGQAMPVDIWTMHLYILPEVQPDGETANGIANVALGTDPTLGIRESGGNPAVCSDPEVYCYAEHDKINIFAEQVVAMREWMADHGQKEKPLLLSEYSILYPYIDDGGSCFIQDEFGQCFTPDRVYDFMTQTFSYLNNAKNASLGYSLDSNRLIQQYMWFAIYTQKEGNVSNLVEKDLVTLTDLGNNFKAHATGETPTHNLLIDKVNDVNAITTGGSTADTTISVIFRNNGNAKIDKPFTVTFYRNAAMTNPIGSTIISNDVYGCANRPYTASVEWNGLSEGVHKFWVKIDSENDISEVPGDGDNVGSGQVKVGRNGLYLPVVQAVN